MRIWTSGSAALAVGGGAPHLALMNDGDYCVATGRRGATRWTDRAPLSPLTPVFSHCLGGSDAMATIYTTEPLEAVLKIEQPSAAVTTVDSRGLTILTGNAAGSVNVTLLLRL